MNLKLFAILFVALFAVAVNGEFGEDDFGVGRLFRICQYQFIFAQSHVLPQNLYFRNV